MLMLDVLCDTCLEKGYINKMYYLLQTNKKKEFRLGIITKSQYKINNHPDLVTISYGLDPGDSTGLKILKMFCPVRGL